MTSTSGPSKRPDMFLPVEFGGTDTWATLWARWRENTCESQDHDEFEVPPAEVIALIHAWGKLKYEVNDNEVRRLADILFKSQVAGRQPLDDRYHDRRGEANRGQ